MDEFRIWIRRVAADLDRFIAQENEKKNTTIFDVPCTEQLTAIGDVLKERAHQDQKHGGPAHDDTHSVTDWLEWILNRCTQIEHLSVPTPTRNAAHIYNCYRDISALGLAAMESFLRRPIPERGERNSTRIEISVGLCDNCRTSQPRTMLVSYRAANQDERYTCIDTHGCGLRRQGRMANGDNSTAGKRTCDRCGYVGKTEEIAFFPDDRTQFCNNAAACHLRRKEQKQPSWYDTDSYILEKRREAGRLRREGDVCGFHGTDFDGWNIYYLLHSLALNYGGFSREELHFLPAVPATSEGMVAGVDDQFPVFHMPEGSSERVWNATVKRCGNWFTVAQEVAALAGMRLRLLHSEKEPKQRLALFINEEPLIRLRGALDFESGDFIGYVNPHEQHSEAIPACLVDGMYNRVPYGYSPIMDGWNVRTAIRRLAVDVGKVSTNKLWFAYTLDPYEKCGGAHWDAFLPKAGAGEAPWSNQLRGMNWIDAANRCLSFSGHMLAFTEKGIQLVPDRRVEPEQGERR